MFFFCISFHSPLLLPKIFLQIAHWIASHYPFFPPKLSLQCPFHFPISHTHPIFFPRQQKRMHFCSFSFQYSGAGLFDSPVCILECRIFWNYPTDLRKTHRKILLILSYVGLVGEGDTVTYPWCDGVGNSDLIRIFETDFGYLCCNVCLVCPSTSWTTDAHRVQSSGGWWWCWGEEGVKSGWFIKAHWQLAGHYRVDWVGVFPPPLLQWILYLDFEQQFSFFPELSDCYTLYKTVPLLQK